MYAEHDFQCFFEPQNLLGCWLIISPGLTLHTHHAPFTTGGGTTTTITQMAVGPTFEAFLSRTQINYIIHQIFSTLSTWLFGVVRLSNLSYEVLRTVVLVFSRGQ
jgi:hypothetical protein